MEYIRKQYNLPFLRCQMRVAMDGKPGQIVGSDGPYLCVRFDGQRPVKRVHPTWQMTYYDEKSQIVKDYKEVKI